MTVGLYPEDPRLLRCSWEGTWIPRLAPAVRAPGLLVLTCSWGADRVSVIGSVNNKGILKACLSYTLPSRFLKFYEKQNSDRNRSLFLTQPGNGLALWNLWKARKIKEKEAMDSLCFSYVWRTLVAAEISSNVKMGEEGEERGSSTWEQRGEYTFHEMPMSWHAWLVLSDLALSFWRQNKYTLLGNDSKICALRKG